MQNTQDRNTVGQSHSNKQDAKVQKKGDALRDRKQARDQRDISREEKL